MGYHTEFRGVLHFTTKLTAPQQAAIQQILGEDCRNHPEWDASDLTRIDLVLLVDGNGISWDGSECTTDMPEKVNVVIREMQKQYPDFGLSGVMTAQGSDVGDIWELYIGEDGFARKRELMITSKSLDDLRNDFEDMAARCMFGLSRRDNGEYKGNTFILWAGYWECAVKNGVLRGDDALRRNMHKLCGYTQSKGEFT